MRHLKQILAVFLSACLVSPLCCCASAFGEVAAPERPSCCHSQDEPADSGQPCGACECVSKGDLVAPNALQIPETSSHAIEVPEWVDVKESPVLPIARDLRAITEDPPPPSVSLMFCVLRL